MFKLSLSFWSWHFQSTFFPFQSLPTLHAKFWRQRVSKSQSLLNFWSPLENALTFYPRGASKYVTSFYPSTLIHISIIFESSLPAAFLYCKRYRITPVKTNYHHQLNCILICTIFDQLWVTGGAYLNCCCLLACWHCTGCRKMVIPQCITLTSALHPIYACLCSYCSRPSVSKVRCCSVQRVQTQRRDVTLLQLRDLV